MAKRKPNYLLWVLIGVILILILIILYLANNSFKTKIDNSLSDTSPLDTSPSDTAQPVDKCTKAFNDCMEIGRARGYTITLINKNHINNYNEANTFYRHWRGVQQSDYLISEISKTGETLSYPVTMFVVESKYGVSAPLNATTVICNSDGTLLKVTSAWACGK